MVQGVKYVSIMAYLYQGSHGFDFNVSSNMPCIIEPQ